MQEPRSTSADIIKQENSDPNTANEELVQDTSATSETELDVSDEPEQEPEVDPWEALEIEAAKWKDQAVRTAAELDNFRKRMTREKLDAVRYGNQSLLEELLPVLDNFDMGMQAASQEQGSMLYMGMDMVHKQLGEFLGSQNVTEIPAKVGGHFDPNLHEALSQEASDEIGEGKIIRVVRKGYNIGDRLLRPANVIVSLGQSSPAAEPQPENE